MIERIRTSADDADFRYLIELLDRDLWSRYPETQQLFDKLNKIKLEAKAVVAYQEGRPAGCGCFRVTEDESVVEIKRMYVKDEFRGQGIASAILEELERWAKEEGKRRAILETGNKQPEAIALYIKKGYVRTENYGPYIDSEQSVCMAKEL